jgi:xanthosine utilization system XapX-like protein
MTLQLDPQHPGSVMRFLLAAEAIGNVIQGAFFLIWPHDFLRMAFAEGAPIDAGHVTLLRICGLIVGCCFSVQLALTVPNTPAAIDGRRGLYLGYAAVEAATAVFFGYCGMLGPEDSALDPGVCRTVVKQMIGLVVLRAVPLWKTEWFGRYTIVVGIGDRKRE